MIAAWIADALAQGQDHLELTMAQLAHWQRHGCLVSLGAPWGSLGTYGKAHTGQMGLMLERHLESTPLERWPNGYYQAGGSSKGIWVCMPKVEATEAGHGLWRVPLIPSDINHCLNSWDFDLHLSPEQLEALRPVALQLVRRMVVRCEIPSYASARGQSILWQEGRRSFATMAGVDHAEMTYWFMFSSSFNGAPLNPELFDTNQFQRAWLARQIAKENQAAVGPMRTVITEAGDFIQEAQIEPIKAMEGSYHLQFISRMTSAKNPAEARTNLSLIVERDDLYRLKRLIDDALMVPDMPPKPLGQRAPLGDDPLSVNEQEMLRYFRGQLDREYETIHRSEPVMMMVRRRMDQDQRHADSMERAKRKML